MRRADDVSGEMDRSARLESLLAGEAADEREARLAEVLRDLREGLLEPPSEELAARHLAAMSAAARELPSPIPLRRRSPMRPATARRIAVVGLAAATLLTGGLAWAGALPTPAQDAIAGVASHLGLDLPSSDDQAPAGEHGAEVSEVARDPSLQGCEKGQAVAAVASEPSQAHRQDPARDHDPCAASEATQGDVEGRGADRQPGPPEDAPAPDEVPVPEDVPVPEGVPGPPGS